MLGLRAYGQARTGGQPRVTSEQSRVTAICERIRFRVTNVQRHARVEAKTGIGHMIRIGSRDIF